VGGDVSRKPYDYDAHLVHFGVNLGIDQEKLAWYDEVEALKRDRAASSRSVPLKDRATAGCLAVPERSGRRDRP
jgi:hypothetical protein